MSRKTFYQLVIDRSGSMQSSIEETVIGINIQIKHIREVGLRNPDNEVFVSLYLFNHYVSKIYQQTPARDLKDITYADYKPDGLSGLYDAIGTATDDLEEALCNCDDEEDNNVVMFIFSDGNDNASRTYTIEKIRESISSLIKTKRWSFYFIGSTLESKQIAENLSIPAYNSLFFSVDNILKILDQVGE